MRISTEAGPISYRLVSSRIVSCSVLMVCRENINECSIGLALVLILIRRYAWENAGLVKGGFVEFKMKYKLFERILQLLEA